MKTFSSGRFFFPLLMLAFAAIPARAFAAAQITEIMYDLPGSNAGRQWIEVVNTGSASIDLAGYKLLQDGTNHALKIAQGSSVLTQGGVAILAENPQDFLADNPGFSGALFKSAFSLTNKGETLTLKDASGAALDTVSYDSSMGASGDGNSLHRNGATFVPGLASPGVYPDAPSSAPPPPSAAPQAEAPAPIRYTGTIAAQKSPAQKPQSPGAATSAPAKKSAGPSVGYAGADQTAAAQGGLNGVSLAEVVAGSAAFGVVVLGGLILQGGVRLRRAEAPADPATQDPADEFEIIDGTSPEKK